MEADVVLHEGGEAGEGDAEADGAGAEIDFAAVFRAAGVALDAAHLTQAGHFLRRLAAEEAVDGMEDGAGVGFYGDAVLGFKDFEIEGGHDADDAGAACLVAADLQAIAVGANVVGVVDHPGGEPEELALDLVKRGEALGWERRDGARGGVHAQPLASLRTAVLALRLPSPA